MMKTVLGEKSSILYFKKKFQLVEGFFILGWFLVGFPGFVTSFVTQGLSHRGHVS